MLPKFFTLSKLSFDKKILIMELWFLGLSTNAISRLTSVSRKAIWTFLKKLGKFIVPRYYLFLRPIGGKSTIVEIDESKFGK